MAGCAMSLSLADLEVADPATAVLGHVLQVQCIHSFEVFWGDIYVIECYRQRKFVNTDFT